MNRAALEHIVRAAAAACGEREIVIIGSQAVLGQFPHAPETLLASLDADVFPRYAPDKSDLIDGAIGELSMFLGLVLPCSRPIRRNRRDPKHPDPGSRIPNPGLPELLL